ncbi:MAG TPA: leucine zipper domain-containing protein [Acidimicrobiia bacterium]
MPVFRDQPAHLLLLATSIREKGLEGLRDRSRRPHHSPNATSAEVVGKIVNTPEPSLRAGQDLDVSQALPRDQHQPFRCLACPAAARVRSLLG